MFTVVEPIGIAPSPLPESSHAALEKNSIVIPVMFGGLFRIPWIVVAPPAEAATVRTGKLLRLRRLFGVTPSG